ncbi:MAG: hypothetical protein HRT73_05545 [Flavobacteriales bacterium]|nr:hypothetical protein [Flavobacteriales bacterium]
MLTSDANGNATWRGALAFKANKAAGSTYVNGDYLSGYTIEYFDGGNGWSNDRYTVPETGIYSFTVACYIAGNAGNVLRIHLEVNGATRATKRDYVQYTALDHYEYTFLVSLTAGETVRFRHYGSNIFYDGSTNPAVAVSTIQGSKVK